eukprot:CAMPEP_0176226434 /NCGR_PEP_ID=MMETSP0121_2-20121125/22260_1 /TAXON_ID=160619 /ORGANISM="Kryptoperidinium foliaceum, Strain CCMP 1326" /LENGTH=311 /DNA_ID=CAMNT_0017565703 /DNA_START=44 /DNA_END=979 /DNA_ORIENTATION=+
MSAGTATLICVPSGAITAMVCPAMPSGTVTWMARKVGCGCGRPITTGPSPGSKEKPALTGPCERRMAKSPFMPGRRTGPAGDSARRSGVAAAPSGADALAREPPRQAALGLRLLLGRLLLAPPRDVQHGHVGLRQREEVANSLRRGLHVLGSAPRARHRDAALEAAAPLVAEEQGHGETRGLAAKEAADAVLALDVDEADVAKRPRQAHAAGGGLEDTSRPVEGEEEAFAAEESADDDQQTREGDEDEGEDADVVPEHQRQGASDDRDHQRADAQVAEHRRYADAVHKTLGIVLDRHQPDHGGVREPLRTL